MNLLLLLSAMLSAFTGIRAEARSPAVAQSIARAAVAQAEPSAEARDRVRFMLPVEVGSDRVEHSAYRPFSLVADEPLWAKRRRE